MSNQAILTKYHPPSSVTGARISATSASGIRIYIPYPNTNHINEQHEDDLDHREAANKLAEKLNWHGIMISGSTKDGYAFVFI